MAAAAHAHEDVHPVFMLDPKYTFMHADDILNNSVKPFIIPITGLIIGAVMMTIPKVATIGKLVLYFGAQSFMNIYMGWVMRTSVTVPAGSPIPGTNRTLSTDLTGCPAGFALTAFQQVVSFAVFMVFFCGAYFTPYRYTPKKLHTWCEVACVAVFGCVFALNIALNNFSLGYICVAVNLIIRSCLPLTTFLSQQVLAMFKLYPFKPCVIKEISLMVIGVMCAGVFTMAKIMSNDKKKESENMILGCVVCLASLLCGSLNLALAGVLGETKLNVFDTVAYMAIPATLFLAPIAFFVEKPVPGAWKEVFDKDRMTDFEILMSTWSLNRTTMAWLLLSGVFSFAYNIIQFSIVHTLSPSATAFGGNFNKAALVFLTLLLPFLHVHALPKAPYIYIIWCAVICNIAAFSAFSYLQIQAKMEKESEYQPQKDEDESEEEDGESDFTSSDDDGRIC